MTDQGPGPADPADANQSIRLLQVRLMQLERVVELTVGAADFIIEVFALELNNRLMGGMSEETHDRNLPGGNRDVAKDLDPHAL